MPVRVDYSHMLDGVTHAAISSAAMADAPHRFAAIHAALAEQRTAGRLGFLELVDADAPAMKLLRRFTNGVRGAFQDIVVLGVGEGALGIRALCSALRSPHWNELDAAARDGWPRLHVLDSIDPASVLELLGRVELEHTLFVVTSKSGRTTGTLAQYLIVRQRLDDALGDDAHRHLVFITDALTGSLRDLAAHEGTVVLGIPPAAGGCLSVLSAVALFPLGAAGVDIVGLLGGAQSMIASCTEPELLRNPAATLAMMQWLADSELGCRTRTVVPCSDALRDLGTWWVQLWTERLGGARFTVARSGGASGPAQGPSDLRMQLSLLAHIPRDGTVSFLDVDRASADVVIPGLHADIARFASLGGRTLKQVLDSERRAWADTLARGGRPSMAVLVDRVDPERVGQLIMTLELATVYAGMLYGAQPAPGGDHAEAESQADVVR